MKINILGAGMSGLLAANILRRHDITIIEKQSELPNNHHAVLRFRTPEVGNILGIPFKKVNMIKTHVPYVNVVADSLSYSRKTTGQYLSNRSIIEGTVIAERYIAPPDLIAQMAQNVNINYDSFEYTDKLPHISTIPMPMLMNILDYPHVINFKSMPGIVFTGRILDCDAYVSVLFPGPDVPYSRATITGDNLIVEFPNLRELPDTPDLAHVYYSLGLHDCVILDGAFKHQDFFKIIEIDDSERKKFMRWATVNFNIYSLGRYSTWRPKLLLDDLIQDVRKIESWIVGGIVK
jgi:NAD(P)-binding Rossmann-like domain